MYSRLVILLFSVCITQAALGGGKINYMCTCANYSYYNTAIRYVNYTVENAASFNGDNTTATSILCEHITAEILACEPGSKLDDNDNGPLNFLPMAINSYKQFFAFSKDSGTPGILQFHFPNFYSDTLNIVLHFLNFRVQSISLPTVTVQDANSLTTFPFVFAENHDLQPNDARVRNVTLQTILPTPVSSLRVRFSFENHDINTEWLLLSEVDFYNGNNYNNLITNSLYQK